MDLRGQTAGLIFNWDKGETETTVTIFDSTKTVELGNIIIENSKVRALQDAMAQVGLNLFPNTDAHTFDKQKTVYSSLTKDAVLTWES